VAGSLLHFISEEKLMFYFPVYVEPIPQVIVVEVQVIQRAPDTLTPYLLKMYKDKADKYYKEKNQKK
jgi:hypothetical protein